MVMKTSPKTSVALLAILALGGSTAGSLFSESLQTNVIGTIGSASAFFPVQVIQNPAQQATFIAIKSKPDVVVDVVALPIDAITLTPVPVIEIQVRAITSPEIDVTPSPSAVPTPTPEAPAVPEVVTEPSPTPEPSPEVSASQVPELQPVEQISTPE
jgi:hypothetical protein